MAIVWAALLMSAIVCTSSQYIYPKENDRCASNRETMMEIRELLIQQERIKKSVEFIGQMVKRLKEDVTKTHEDVQIIKRGLEHYTDCRDYYLNGYKESGVYLIYPLGLKNQMRAYCDMEVQGGGWTAIQKRTSGSVGFNRTWADYKKGFGDVTDSYWIGNDVIHQLTKGRNSSLYVSITLTNGTTLYELYNQFSVSGESDKYRLFLGGPATGTLGDRMLNTGMSPYNLSGMYFSTPDRDNGRYSHIYSDRNCAAYWGGGCHAAFLNGPWSSTDWYNPWSPTVMYSRDIEGVLMMIKAH
ncbi:fibroleukin-like [Saccostrea cucullata]|uniref:fibroleukin-like n=1 Tax=Saccostrea cuccullata TaxID=36930 RepID=UPI002ED532E5